MKAIKTAAVYGGAGGMYLDQETCFKTTSVELSESGHIFIFGINFDEPVFMHAITHVADMYEGYSWSHVNKNEWFQNYNIYIGNSSDYTKNTKCAGGPFLRTDDPDSYVLDEYA